MHIFTLYPDSIGNTPMVSLSRLNTTQATVLAKVEGRNPSFSVKCRLGAALIADAVRHGLKAGSHIVEPTSGNTGIALAYIAAAKGYKLTLTMPETMSIERRKLLAFLGAHIVLTPGSAGMSGAITKAQEMAEADPSIFLPLQFSNPANPDIHEATTGPEIWEQTAGSIDVLVAGVGSGGTITGISRYIKHTQKKQLMAVAVEPEKSPVITQALAGKPLTPGPHGIQGIGAGFIPVTLDLDILDRVEQVSDDDAYAYTRLLARKEGILAGPSSGAALAAAMRLAEQKEFAGKTIVVILPDLAERYISTPLFESS